MSSATKVLETLFPTPSNPLSHLSPIPWPGVDARSTLALQKALKDNHQRWHAFFDDRGFHNHAAHHLLAIHSLGASAPVIDAAYQTHVIYQRPAIPSPALISNDTFYNHIGKSDYYSGYLAFFTDALLKNGATATIEKYIFSQAANFDPAKVGDGQTQPEFLNRFVGGLLHPMIHVGYGLEFGLLGTLAEGLAQTAIHQARLTNIIPRRLFTANQGAADTGVTQSPDAVSADNAKIPHGTHVFTIMARMLKDPSLKIKKPNPEDKFIDDVNKTHGDRILKYAEQWTLDTSNPNDMERKIEELVWMNTLLYGVGGYRKATGFKADFFLMHLVTSSIFLRTVSSHLTPASQNAFLRTYLATSLLWWVIVGLPRLNISEYYTSTNAHPLPPSANTTPDASTLPSQTSPYALTPNAWLPIIQTALVHPGEHLCKIQRALAHFARLYGSRTAGQTDFCDTELEGAEQLDGSLFLRVAGETANKMGWMREGEKAGQWDRFELYDV